MQLIDALQWCLDLGVQAMTVYAFSIDNFRRESEEVDALMTLAEEKLLDLLNVSVLEAVCSWDHYQCPLRAWCLICMRVVVTSTVATA